MAVAFFDNGKACVLARGVNGGRTPVPVTPKTVFAMGSVQKVFNSVLLAYEIVQGKATIDDTAAKYLVAANGTKVSPGSAFSEVTLRNLATHTSSLPRSLPGQPAGQDVGAALYGDRPMPPSVIAYLNSWQPPYPPGTRYVYSNFGFTLLAYAASTLADKPYTELLSEAVTGPIGMTRTAPAICNSPNPTCALGHNAKGRPEAGTLVGLWTTADDMLRFIEANLGVLRLPDLQVRAINLSHQEMFRENPNHAVGIGWEEWHSGNALLLSKNGDELGFASWLALEPNRHRGVAVLSNEAGKLAPASLGQELLNLAADY